MKRIAPLGLVIAILMAVIAASSPARVNAQSAGLVSSLLNRIERNHRSLKSLRAGISMEKYNAQIGDSDRYSGIMLYMPAAGRNAYVRVEWQRPQHEILAVANGNYTLFRPRLNMVYEGSARSNRNKAGGILELMNLSGQQLRARFDLQDYYPENLWGGVSTEHLRLVPKGRENFKYAEVWVDGVGMPVQAKVVEKNDDATTIRLTDMEKNARISTDEFRIQLPGDVKRVRG